MTQVVAKKIDFQLSLTVNELIQKLAIYQLSPEDFKRGFDVDKRKIELLKLQLERQNHSQEFSELIDAIYSWPVIFTLDIKALNERVNLFISTFLDWHKQGGNAFNNVQLIIQCVSIRTLFSSQKSYQFQLFLFGLIAETVSHYNQLKLHYYEQHHPTSSLPNHRFLEQMLAKLSPENSNTHIALMILSLKTGLSTYNAKINDDKLISHVINLLTPDLISNAKLFHTDHSELTLYFSSVADRTRLELVATKIRRVFEHALMINNEAFFVNPTLAYAYGQVAETSGTDLLKQARLALENAKITEESLVCYSSLVESNLAEQKALESDVISAFNQNAFAVYFQPIINLADQTCVGAESLLRWPGSPKSVIPPVMIEILNKRGLSSMFTRWLINSVCRIGKSLVEQSGNEDFYLTINLRAEDLVDEELPFLLSQSMDLWGLSPKNIVLEVTESGFLADEEFANRTLTQLISLGCKIALDDFGTGYSSMLRLRNMPVHLVKIDQSFIRNVAKSNQDAAIVRAIISLCRTFGKEVVAEGIEDESCLQTLTEMQCQKLQGYYYSKPLSQTAFTKWFSEFSEKAIPSTL